MGQQGYWYLGALALAVGVASVYSQRWVVAVAAVIVGAILIQQGFARGDG